MKVIPDLLPYLGCGDLQFDSAILSRAAHCSASIAARTSSTVIVHFQTSLLHTAWWQILTLEVFACTRSPTHWCTKLQVLILQWYIQPPHVFQEKRYVLPLIPLIRILIYKNTVKKEIKEIENLCFDMITLNYFQQLCLKDCVSALLPYTAGHIDKWMLIHK